MSRTRSRFRITTWVLPLLLGCTNPTLQNKFAEISGPATLDFGAVSGSGQLSQQVTLTDIGLATLKISSATVTGDEANAFSVKSVPSQVSVGASGSLTVVMTPPATSGLHGASLVIASNASNAPQLLVQLSVYIDPAVVDDAGTIDAGTVDAGTADAGLVDAGTVDAGTVDAGTVDAGTVDAGTVDAGTVDAGTVDAGTVDAGTVDAGTVDAGTVDAGAVDAGLIDAGATPDAGTPDGGPDSGSTDAGATDAGCPQGQMRCSSGCVDLTNDPFNCGMCQMSCASAGVGCVNGVCEACEPETGYITLTTDAGLPEGLAVDQSYVYWAAASDAAIEKVAVDGGTPTILVNASEVTAPGFFQPWEIAVNSSNVFFSSETNSAVLFTGLNGGTPSSLGTSASWPSRFALSPTHIYWVATTTGDVWRAAFSASSASQISNSAGATGSSFQLIGIDSTSVYWLTFGGPGTGAIMSADLNGGLPTTLLSGLAEPIDGAADDTGVYWTDDGAGTVMKMHGGTVETLASGLRGPRKLVINGGDAFWSAGGTDQDKMYCSSVVQSVSLSGGPVKTYVYAQYSAYDVAADASYVYWAGLYEGTIMKTPR